MTTVASTRTLFLSSEYNSFGDSRVLNYNISSQLINYPTSSRLRMTLNSFATAKTWYSVNQFNNTFFIGNTATNTILPVTIPPGNYASPIQYADQLQTSLIVNTTILTLFGIVAYAQFQYQPLTNTIRIRLLDQEGGSVINVPNIKFFSLSVPGAFDALGPLQLALVKETTTASRYNDVDQLLGGRTNRSVQGLSLVSELIDLFEIENPDRIFQSLYPCDAFVNEGVYLRVSSLPTNNVESTNLSPIYSQQDLVSSDIFAVIYPDSSVATSFNTTLKGLHVPMRHITFQDTNNNFVFEIGAPQLTNLRISMTDDKGRLIPLVSPNQANDGSIAFQISIKVEELIRV